MAKNWRRLNKNVVRSQDEGDCDLPCLNCAFLGRAVMADWRSDGGWGTNPDFFCNSCAPLNMLLDLEEKLTALLLAQEDEDLRKLGDAFRTRRDKTRERRVA